MSNIEFSYLDLDNGDTSALDAFVRGQAAASAYHLPAWCRAVGAAYGYRSQALLAYREGRLAGMLPLCFIARPLGAMRWVSLPFCDLGGPVAEDAELAAALGARARQDLAARQVAGLELRGSGVQTDEIDLSGRKVRMLLDLPENAETLFKTYPPKLRSQVRKAEKNGLRAEMSTAPGAIAAFYDVYSRNMRRLGSPPHSLAWFEAVHRYYGAENMFVMLVYSEDKVIGAGWVLLCGDKAVIPWASTLADYNRLAPNMLLYHAILAHLSDSGIRQFDFGRSTFGEGTYKFKEQWGARPCPLDWQQWKAGMESPCADAGAGRVGRIRPLIEEVWRRLPLGVTNQLGPRMRRYITL